MGRLQYWILSKKTRDMFHEAYDLRRAGRYREALEKIEEVLEFGEAFAKGYAIPSIILDKRCRNGSVEFIAWPWIIEEVHHLDKDKDIIYCEGQIFRIESHAVKTRKDDPIRYASGNMLVYQGRKVEDKEAGELVVAPWDNLDLVKERKFSRYKPFLGQAPERISGPCAHSPLRLTSPRATIHHYLPSQSPPRERPAREGRSSLAYCERDLHSAPLLNE